MNIERLKELQQILLDSETYDQGRYFSSDVYSALGYEAGKPLACQTPACVAGHAVFHFGDKDFDPATETITEVADRVLGLDNRQSADLFRGFPFGDVTWDKATVQDAVAAIQSLIDTGIVTWTKISADQMYDSENLGQIDAGDVDIQSQL